MKFNSNDNFDSSTYVKVNERLTQFRKDHPDGRITTFRTDVANGAVFKCVLCRDINDAQEYALTSIAPATGHSFLPSGIRGDKVEEFTETVAIGRALAILGYGVEKSIASAEEMERFQNNKNNKPTFAPDHEEGGSESLSGSLPKLKSSNKFSMAKINKEQ